MHKCLPALPGLVLTAAAATARVPDNFVSFDSSRRMGIYNNGAAVADVPVAGIAMQQLPGDTGYAYVPAGSFMSWFNDNSANRAVQTNVF